MQSVSIFGSTGVLGQLAFSELYSRSESYLISDLYGREGMTLAAQREMSNARVFAEVDDLGLLNATGKVALNCLPGLASIEAQSTVPGSFAKTITASKEYALMQAADTSAIQLLDSELSSLEWLVRFHGAANICKVYLPATGGKFGDYGKQEFLDSRWASASVHPVWRMGHRTNFHSNTMVNKLYEALCVVVYHGFEPNQVEVFLDPSGLTHAAVLLRTGEVARVVSNPDMRQFIGFVLSPTDAVRWHHSVSKAAPNTMLNDLELDKYPPLRWFYSQTWTSDQIRKLVEAVELGIDVTSKRNLCIGEFYEIVSSSLMRIH